MALVEKHNLVGKHNLSASYSKLIIPCLDICNINKAFGQVETMTGDINNPVKEIRCNIRTAKKFDKFGKTIFDKSSYNQGENLDGCEIYGYLFSATIVIDKHMSDHEMVFITDLEDVWLDVKCEDFYSIKIIRTE